MSRSRSVDDSSRKPGMINRFLRLFVTGATLVGGGIGVYEGVQEFKNLHEARQRTANWEPRDYQLLDIEKNISLGKTYPAFEYIVRELNAQAISATDFWHALSRIMQANSIGSNQPFLFLSTIPRNQHHTWSALEWTDNNWSEDRPFDLAMDLFTNEAWLKESGIVNVAGANTASGQDHFELMLLTEQHDAVIVFNSANGKLLISFAMKNPSSQQFDIKFTRQYDYRSMSLNNLREKISEDLRDINTNKFVDTAISVSHTTFRSYSMELPQNESAVLINSAQLLSLNGILNVTIAEEYNNEKASVKIFVQTSGGSKRGSGFSYTFEVYDESIIFQGTTYESDDSDYQRLLQIVDSFLNPDSDLIAVQHSL